MRQHLLARSLMAFSLILLPFAAFAAGARVSKAGVPKAENCAPKVESSTPKVGSVFKDCSYCPEMVVIPAGSFAMGSVVGEEGRSEDEGPQHQVKLSQPFAMSKTEVTQAQWVAVMGKNPSHFASCGANCPVEKVSWNDVQEYLSRLNARTGKRYLLPSEAEWEYACRAGGTQPYCGGSDIDTIAWHHANSSRKPQPVSGKQANAWGLSDMSGNVFEWVEDCWNKNYEDVPTDGSAWMSGDCSSRVLRGGAWFSEPGLARAAKRLRLPIDDRNGIAGFRVVRTLP